MSPVINYDNLELGTQTPTLQLPFSFHLTLPSPSHTESYPTRSRCLVRLRLPGSPELPVATAALAAQDKSEMLAVGNKIFNGCGNLWGVSYLYT